MKKNTLLRVGIVAAVIVVAAALLFAKPVIRLLQVMNLFSPAGITHNFAHMDDIFDSEPVAASPTPTTLVSGLRPLPETYVFRGETKKTADFLQATDTTAFLVLYQGKLVVENYYQGTTAQSHLISWSLSKSMISALLGIAMREGYITDLSKPVDEYVPALKGTGYQGIRLLDVLHMASGIGFDETYSNSNSDINRMGRVLALNTPIDDFVKSLKNAVPPGQKLHYVSMDTQVLYMVLRETLKKAGFEFQDYFARKLWQPMGAESPALWLLDSQKHELAFGGLNATARDYARFGLLYLNQGRANGAEVVPADWVQASTAAQEPFLQPGKELSKQSLGYGYQWWLPFNNDGDFIGLGIYSQFIYVYPKQQTVIVKLSAFKDYNQKGPEAIVESIELFRSIARALAAQESKS